MTYRAFTQASYWNTPMPSDAPIDANSRQYIDWLVNNDPTGYPVVGGHSGWAHPVYFAKEIDPLVTMRPEVFVTSMQVTFHLPKDAVPMTGPDAEMSVIDVATNQDVQLFKFSRDTNGTPHCDGIGRYYLDSEGLAESVGGTRGNVGHRGIPGFEHAFLGEEVLRDKVINRRLKFSIPDTKPLHYWPMGGHEARTGVIPEGIVMRIKRSVDLSKRLSGSALVIARAFKNYGILVGDTSGLGNRTSVKGQMDIDWTNLLERGYFALESLPFSTSWEFVQGGYRP